MRPPHAPSMPNADVIAVDDEASIVALVHAVLSDVPLVVDACPPDPTAHDCIRTRRPKVVLLEVAMQRVDGVTLFRQLQADPSTRDIAVIFFTAFGSELQQRVPNYRELGVQVLPKPCPIDHIRQVVTTTIAAQGTCPPRSPASTPSARRSCARGAAG